MDSRGRPKQQPACPVERDARSGLIASLKALKLANDIPAASLPARIQKKCRDFMRRW